MARTWLTIRVELLGGRGEDLWPPPGRVVAVGLSHTFADLATIIDDAFARWDRRHLCQFTLSDGTVVTDEGFGSELAVSPVGPVAAEPLVLGATEVASQVRPGDEFRYVFDLGDDWVHACAVESEKIDPGELFGGAPTRPRIIFGWGAIPDQHGRRWERDGTGEPPPRRPRGPHPMLAHSWPDPQPMPLDAREFRGATYRRDADAIVSAIQGREITDALQQVGIAVQVVLGQDRSRVEQLAASVVNRLGLRGAPGDDVLAEDLIGELLGTPVHGRRLPVDLSELADALHGDPLEPAGALDLVTGEVVPAALLDEAWTGDEAIDIEDDPDRWLVLDRLDSRDGWNDMAEFAARQADPVLRHRLEDAIAGKGAFRRFRDAVHAEDIADEWRLFSDDRAMGRARAYLAAAGIRVLPVSS